MHQHCGGSARVGLVSRVAYVCLNRHCPVLHHADMLIVVYHQPTISICRAEQWAAACKRLGLPESVQSQAPSRHSGTIEPRVSNSSMVMEERSSAAAVAAADNHHQGGIGGSLQHYSTHAPVGLLTPQMAAHQANHIDLRAASLFPTTTTTDRPGSNPGHPLPSQRLNGYQPEASGISTSPTMGVLGQHHQHHHQQGPAAAAAAVGDVADHSSHALAEWMQEEYEAAGLSRRLTDKDMQVSTLHSLFA
jgi:hypothetical protein